MLAVAANRGDVNRSIRKSTGTRVDMEKEGPRGINLPGCRTWGGVPICNAKAGFRCILLVFQRLRLKKQIRNLFDKAGRSCLTVC
jgi:hypothetical protein